MRLLIITLRKHASFVVLLFSSLIFFLVNILLKSALSVKDYGNYALLLTFISISFSLGLFSLEQLILRFSYLKNNFFYINEQFVINFIISFILSVVIFYIIGISYFSVSSIYLIILSVGSIILMLMHNIYRIMHYYVYSQVLYNIWKVILLFFILNTINQVINFNDLFYVILISIFFLSMLSVAFFFFFFKIKLYNNENENISIMQMHFFISMLVLTFLSYGDRFLIEYYLGIEQVGEYFYYVTVILFPYILFQNYFGFKELPQFRKKFTLKILRIKIFKSILTGIVLSFIIAIVLYGINSLDFDFMKEIHVNNYFLVFIMMLTGLIKIVYSILSSAVGATSNKTTIEKLNYITIIVTLIIITIFLFFEQKSIELVAILYLSLWLVRSFIYYYKGLRYVSES